MRLLFVLGFNLIWFIDRWLDLRELISSVTYLLLSLDKFELEVFSRLTSLRISLTIYIFSIFLRFLLLGRFTYGFFPIGKFFSSSFKFWSIESTVYFSISDYFNNLDVSKYFTQLSMFSITFKLFTDLRSKVLFIACFAIIFSIDLAFVLVLHNFISDILVF